MNNNQPTLLLTPIRQAAPDAGGTLEVLVRLQAPDALPEESGRPARAPLRLAVVIDRSGSMSGQPLHEALRCAEYIAGGLQPTDQIGVVVYDDTVDVPVRLGPAGAPDDVRLALAGIESGGSTALYDGWQAGASMLEGGTPHASSRVLLLSDGQANHGLCDATEINKQCARWAANGVTTTTVGLGPNFNEDLMIGMARAGNGQQYYGQTAEDLHDSFDEELSLLTSLFLRQVRIKLVAGAGVLAEPLGMVQMDGTGRYQLPDLAWGAEVWMLVRLHLSPVVGADPRQQQALLAVAVEGQLEGAEAVQLHGMLSLPRVSAADARGLPRDELVARRLKEVEFAEAALKVHALVASGDMQEAKALLAKLGEQVADHPWLAEKVARLKELTERDAALSAKEMLYTAHRTSSRQAMKSEPAYQASETDSREVPAFLRRKASEGEGRKPKS